MDELNAVRYEEMPCDKCSHGWEWHSPDNYEGATDDNKCGVDGCHCHKYKSKTRTDPTYVKESRRV
jgi:hypothetical protein